MWLYAKITDAQDYTIYSLEPSHNWKNILFSTWKILKIILLKDKGM